MNRTDARELIMKLLFQMEAQKDYCDESRERFFKDYAQGSSQQPYLDQMGLLISMHLNESDQLIAANSDHWKLERLNKVDLAVLRLAILEIMHMDDIPDSVAINEAVEIAKKYGTEGSGKYVNGILGKIAKIKHADE